MNKPTSCAKGRNTYQRIMGYSEQRYPVSIAVRVEWADGLTHKDEVKGLNTGHALWRAWQNWPDATIISLRDGQWSRP